jgi:hypothetical protein
MHRYYVHVLDSLLQHNAAYSVYEVRHPIPPYVTHYGSLLLLFHLMPYDWAEKVFSCVVLFCLAYGLRRSAMQIGPNGKWMSLLCAPLLLGWPLMMGFFNFTLGVGLLLFCTACWQRLLHHGVRTFIAFVLFLILVTFTHPLPLLLLILLCGTDLTLSLLLRRRGLSFSDWARKHRFQVGALLLSLMAAAFPALAIDSSRTGSTLHLFGFHPEFLRTSLLLSGVSPYNTRSFDVWINLYRLCLYAIFIGCMWVGGRAALQSIRKRELNFGTTLFIATALLTIALPFLPNMVNGSDYFSSRLVFVLWPGAILAASAAPPVFKWQRVFILASVLCCILTLIPAELFFHPVARDLHAAEQQKLPNGEPGSLLMGDDQDNYFRFKKQLGFDPYKWGGILAFVHANDVALDSPWIDQRITPIEATPGGPELVEDIAYTRIRKPGSLNAPLIAGRSLPGRSEARIVQESSFMLFAGTPAELSQGLSGQLSPREAAKYHCTQPQYWYLICASGVN